ncbi:MAG: tetratricopeptide repeat protein [bacterium]|nr:tetratricopeptide repeat protein [bacterium]
MEGRDYPGRPALGDETLKRQLLEAKFDPVRYGTLLFGALFPRESGQLLKGYHGALLIAEQERRRLRFRLHIAISAPPKLHELHWERLYNPERKVALSCSRTTAFSRYLSVASGPGTAVVERLKLLVVVSDPTNLAKYDLDELDREQSEQAIRRALKPLGERVSCEFLEGRATVGRIRERLVAGGFHALHLQAHGRLRSDKGVASLVLEDDDQRAAFIEEGLFADVFEDNWDLRLVTLIACHSGTPSREEPFSGLGPALVKRGIPAVVAMQRAVSVDAAARFTKHFYRNLARDGRIDAATNEARQQLHLGDRDGLEWDTPALFMRLADGCLWTAQPRVRPRRRLAVAAIALVMAVLIGYFLSLGFKDRRSVAVLGFENRSGQEDAAWLSPAIAETLRRELRAGDEIRTIAGDRIAQVKRALPLSDPESLNDEDLDLLRPQLGADFVVLGSYHFVEGEENLRVDVELQDGLAGEVLEMERVTGSDRKLFDLIHRVAGSLRQDLGLGGLTPAQVLEIQATLPTDREAASCYFDGLARLWRWDVLGAHEVLEAAVAADPEHPLPHAAAAKAWLFLGYREKAREAAEMARELWSSLPQREKGEIEALYYETDRNWEEAIESYSSLFESYPEDVNYGFQLADTLILAKKHREALVTLRKLGELPGMATDPWIDLYQVRAHYGLDNYKEAKEFARKAVSKGQALGADLVKAEVRMREALVLQSLGKHKEAVNALEKARSLYEVGGDQLGLARTLHIEAETKYEQGDLEEALKLAQRSVDIYNDIGYKKDEAAVLTSMGHFLSRQGEIVEAEDLYYKARATFEEIGAKFEAAVTLSAIGDISSALGELTVALERYQEAQALFEELKNKGGLAVILTNIAEIHFLRGNLEQALEMHERAFEINHEIGDWSGKAYDGFRMGKVLAVQGDLGAARAKYKDAYATQNRLGEIASAAETRVELAKLDLLRDSAEEAERLADQAAEVFLKGGMVDSAALAQSVLARSLLAQGKVTEAREVIDSALDSLDSGGDRVTRLATGIVDALVRARSGETKEIAAALENLEALASKAAEVDFVEFEFEARLAAGEIEVASGNLAAAEARLDELMKDAKEKGFEQIAKRAAEVIRP